MKINKNLHLPLYHQIEKILEENIVSGKWEPGFQLPTEKKLAETFEVSNITIKRAIIELVNKGLLYRLRGKGTFVAQRASQEREISSDLTIIDEGDGDHLHKTLNFSIESADMSVAKLMGVNKEESIINLIRLKIEDDEPTGIEYTYLPYKSLPGFSPELVEDNLIYNVLRNKYNINLSQAKIFFSTTMADEYQAKVLDIEPETPLFIWERITYSKENQVVEFSKMVFRQDRDRYYLNVSLEEK